MMRTLPQLKDFVSRHLGWSALAAAGLALFASQMHTGMVAGLDQEQAQLQHDLKAFSTSSASVVPSHAPIQSAAPWTQAASVGQVSADLHALAKAEELQLLEVAYTPPKKLDIPGVVSTSISVHLKGSYTGSKRLLAQLLERHANLALASLSLQREQEAAAALNVEIVLNAFTRAEP